MKKKQIKCRLVARSSFLYMKIISTYIGLCSSVKKCRNMYLDGCELENIHYIHFFFFSYKNQKPALVESATKKN